MAPRANWKGFLRLSLVSCPIALYPASSFSEKVSFNRINRKTGNRLYRAYVVRRTCRARLATSQPSRLKRQAN
jgi:DNA end-binding protein Ku